MSKTLGATAGGTELLRLRKELIQAKTQIADLQEELEEKTNQYLNAIKSRNAYKEKLEAAKDNINRVDEIVQQKVRTALSSERDQMQKLQNDFKEMENRLQITVSAADDLKVKYTHLQEENLQLRANLEANFQNDDMREVMRKMDRIRKEKEESDTAQAKMMAEYNKLATVIEDLTAENRTLRSMCDCPDNFGIKHEEIKLLNREKIEDFRKLIKVLQEDNYHLEEERAKLKHLIKTMSMLTTGACVCNYGKLLTKEQSEALEAYARRLIQGDTIELSDVYLLKKENEELKQKLKILEVTGFQTIANHLKLVLKQEGGLFNMFGNDDGKNPLQKLMADNVEIRHALEELLSRGFLPSSDKPADSVRPHYNPTIRPPVPLPDFDGSIGRGISYRFDNSIMSVADKDGNPVTNVPAYENAFYQLQLQELIEMNKRKDEALISQKETIDRLYGKVKEHLAIQDQLYKDYITLERNFERKEIRMKEAHKRVEDQLMDERKTNEKYVNTLKAIQGSSSSEAIQHRIVDLTKSNAINEVNLMKMCRKYQALEEQWKLLSREYHAFDGELAEKDVYVQQRINSLKMWKTEALLQLRLLFDKLKNSMPVTDYDDLRRKLNIQQLKNNTLAEKQIGLRDQIMDLQNQVMKCKEAEINNEINQDIKRNLEMEIEIISKRLERHDQVFKWENQIFSKIAQIILRANIRPEVIFNEFDTNKDGSLDKKEFTKFLEKILASSDESQFSQNEIDILWDALDVSSDDIVTIREFTGKLERFGLKYHSKEEHIIYQLIEAVQRSPLKDLSEFFQVIDKTGRGYITREDFQEMFISTKLKIDDEELKHFMNQFWKDDKAGIDYEGFLRIFKKYQVKLQDEAKRKNVGKYIPITEATLRLKKHYFDEIHKALKATRTTFRELYRKIDSDHSNQLNPDELYTMFKKMNLEMTKEQSDQIFSSMDFDNSGTISEPELIADFNKVVSKTLDDLIFEQKQLKKIQTFERHETDVVYNIDGLLQGEHKIDNLKTRIEILTAKNNSLQKKFDHRNAIVKNIEENQRREELARLEAEDLNDRLRTENIELKTKVNNLELRVQNTIEKKNFESIMTEKEKLLEDLTSTRAAMLSYKKMTEVIAEQAKNIKLMHERKKDEHENLLAALREMQSESATKDRIGKLYFIIMLSRWQEAAVNKKYNHAVNDIKTLRGELLNGEALNNELQRQYNNSQDSVVEHQERIQRLKQQCDELASTFITQAKADDLFKKYQNLCDERADVQLLLFEARNLLHEEKDKNVILTVEKASVDRLFKELKFSQNKEICDTLIKMSEDFQRIKLKEYKLQREHDDMNEKVIYYQRLLKQRNDQIYALEESAASSEAKMLEERENFRKRDLERKAIILSVNRPTQDNFGFKGQSHVFAGLEQAQRLTAGALPTIRTDILEREIARKNMDAQPIFTADWTRNQIAADDGRLVKMEEQIKNLQVMLTEKKQEIDRLNRWGVGDEYLGQDAVLKDQMDEYKARVTAQQEQEAREMAEAAYQTVQTLQNLLDQKKELVRAKEQQIQKLRETMEEQRKIDQDTIAELRNQIAITGSSTLSKLHEAVTRMDSSTAGQTAGQRKAKADLNVQERQASNHYIAELDRKDRKIKELQTKLETSSATKGDFVKKLEEKQSKIDELTATVDKLRDRSDLDKAIKAKEKLMVTIKKKDGDIENLQKAIAKLTDQIVQFQVQNDHHSQETVTFQTDFKITEKKYKEEIQHQIQLKEMAQGKTKEKEAENSRLKAQIENITEKIKDTTAKEAQLEQSNKDIKAVLTRTENKLKEKEAEVKRLYEEHKIGGNIGQASGMSYDALKARYTELTDENRRLNGMMQTQFVVYNRAQGTFEFAGDGGPLDYGAQQNAQTVADVIDAIRAHLSKFERLTYKEIFKSLDKANFGDLSQKDFLLAFEKLGIKLKPDEVRLLKKQLDLKSNNLFEIAPLIRVISGVPTKQFLPLSLLKLAELVRANDWTSEQCNMKFNTHNVNEMDVASFKTAMNNLTSSTFIFDLQEQEELFGYITKQPREKWATVVKLKVDQLIQQVLSAVDAVIIEEVRQALRRKQAHLVDLLHKHDANKDSMLTLDEVQNLMSELGVILPDKTRARFTKQVLDQRDLKRVSASFMQTYFGEDQLMLVADTLDLEPSRESAHQRSRQPPQVAGQFEICRNAARKVLSEFRGRLYEELSKLDGSGEGIVAAGVLLDNLISRNFRDVEPSELTVLVSSCDRGNHGVIVLENFEKKLLDMAAENDGEKIMKRFSRDISKNQTSLKALLQVNDTHKTGFLDLNQFRKALASSAVPLTEAEIKTLFEEGVPPQSTKDGLVIKYFVDKVNATLRQKALVWDFRAPKTAATAKVQTRIAQDIVPEENVGKLKKSVEALKTELEEKNREIKSLNQAIEDANRRALQLDNKIKDLENKLVDKYAKPPQAMRAESLTQGKLDKIEELNERIHHLENVEILYKHTVTVDLKAEISKITQQRDELEERNKVLKEQLNNKKLEIQRMTGQGGSDAVARREMAEESRQKRIEELEREIQALEERFKLVQDNLFVQQERVLDLKFEKENFDLQYARLQKRITDLEQYKLQSAQLSAEYKGKQMQSLAEIKEQSAKLTGDQLAQKPGETVKLRNKSNKSVAELELVIETLRRVSDKQKVEIEALRKTNEGLQKTVSKSSNDAELKVKIGQLERVIHSYEMRDVNVGEQDTTIKKLIFANKQLREDLQREIERYNLLESKYRDLLVKFNVVNRENESNQEYIFSMQTGAHMAKFNKFLDQPETPPKNELDTKFSGFGVTMKTTKESFNHQGLEDSLNKINMREFHQM